MTPTSKTKLVETLTWKGLSRGYHPRRLRAETLFNVDSPDLGWQAARFIADNWVANSSLWSEILGLRGLENVREGVVLRIIRDNGGGTPRKCRIGAEAEKIASDPRSAVLVKALLFAVDASTSEVAKLIGAEPEVVVAFGDLFFDVEGRTDDLLFRQKVALETASARACLLPPSNEAKLRTHLIKVAGHGTMQDVVQQFRLWQGGGSEEEYIATIRNECIYSALSEKFGGRSEAPALAKVGLAIAMKGTDPSAEVKTGTLNDPFLDQLLSDSHAYNETVRERKRVAAEEAENSSPNQTDGSVQP